MPEPLHLGLDLGSLGCRAAYASVAGDPVKLPIPAGWERSERWLWCRAPDESSLSVEFETAKNLLGVQVSDTGGDSRAVAAVRRFLTEMRRAAEMHTGRPCGRLAVSVPALYSASRRTALRETALDCGFSDVLLINDSMAAAIAHTPAHSEPRTLLVFGMGYGGFEVGVIRVAKGSYRAIGYDGSPAAGGAAFDGLLLAAVRQALADAGAWPEASSLPLAGWTSLRSFAQDLKETLASDGSVTLKIRLGPSLVCLPVTRRDFERAIEATLAQSLDVCARLLEEANLIVSDLDEVLLTGGSTGIGLLERLVGERFGRRPVRAPDHILACGAALFAARAGELSTTEAAPSPLAHGPKVEFSASPASVRVRFPPLPGEAGYEPAAPAQPPAKILAVELPPTSVPDAGEAAEIRERWLELVQRLRRYAALRPLPAAAFLREALGELQGLLDERGAPVPDPRSSGMKRETERALAHAEEHLAAGRHHRAIVGAHRAAALDPESAVVLQRVIEIHLRAAAAWSGPEQLKESMSWLLCALEHDRTDRRVQEAVADRYFLHAQQSLQAGDLQTALGAVEECLCYNPDHPQAIALRRDLMGEKRENRLRNVEQADV
jgi:tetratricopeptide (TPR) repeat protein